MNLYRAHGPCASRAHCPLVDSRWTLLSGPRPWRLARPAFDFGLVRALVLSCLVSKVACAPLGAPRLPDTFARSGIFWSERSHAAHAETQNRRKLKIQCRDQRLAEMASKTVYGPRSWKEPLCSHSAPQILLRVFVLSCLKGRMRRTRKVKTAGNLKSSAAISAGRKRLRRRPTGHALGGSPSTHATLRRTMVRLCQNILCACINFLAHGGEGHAKTQLLPRRLHELAEGKNLRDQHKQIRTHNSSLSALGMCAGSRMNLYRAHGPCTSRAHRAFVDSRWTLLLPVAFDIPGRLRYLNSRNAEMLNVWWFCRSTNFHSVNAIVVGFASENNARTIDSRVR